jgi:Asp-tRNA(Asn)/Glu-tRNA(Gln) amidotransferase A subunit family amidase
LAPQYIGINPASHSSAVIPHRNTNPRPTGDPVFNYPSSMLLAPAVTLPMVGVGGMPVGVQLMGQQPEDARVTAIVRWLLASVPPIVVE